MSSTHEANFIPSLPTPESFFLWQRVSEALLRYYLRISPPEMYLKNSIIPFIVYYNIGIRKEKKHLQTVPHTLKGFIFSALGDFSSSSLFFLSTQWQMTSQRLVALTFPNIFFSPFPFRRFSWHFWSLCLPFGRRSDLLCCCALDKWVLWAVLSTTSPSSTLWSLKNFYRFSFPPSTSSSAIFRQHSKLNYEKLENINQH